VYQRSAEGATEFVEVPEPTDEARQAVLHRIIIRMMKLHTRRRVVVEQAGSTCMADNDGDSELARVLRPLQVAACTYRIVFGPRTDQKVLTLQGTMPMDGDFKQTLWAGSIGFSLQVAVRCETDDPQELEQLRRYLWGLGLHLQP
jgi:hypothetical protein